MILRTLSKARKWLTSLYPALPGLLNLLLFLLPSNLSLGLLCQGELSSIVGICRFPSICRFLFDLLEESRYTGELARLLWVLGLVEGILVVVERSHVVDCWTGCEEPKQVRWEHVRHGG